MTANETKALLEKIAALALNLVCEIEKRDGEGNVIPSHLYHPLLASICDASLAGFNVGRSAIK